MKAAVLGEERYSRIEVKKAEKPIKEEELKKNEVKKKKEKELSSGDSSSEDEYVEGRKEKKMLSDSSDEEDTTDFKWMVMNVCARFPLITEKQGILYLKSVAECMSSSSGERCHTKVICCDVSQIFFL